MGSGPRSAARRVKSVVVVHRQEKRGMSGASGVLLSLKMGREEEEEEEEG